MNQEMVEDKKQIERKLALLYGAVSVFEIILSICMGIIWNYWMYTLNTCIDSNCGCLLYASTTYSAFNGGDVSICRLVTFGPLIALFWSILIGLYHTYRLCIIKSRNTSRAGRRPTVTFHTPPETRNPLPKPRKSPLYICLFIMSLSFVFLYVAIAFIELDGYFTACKGYRKEVVKQLSANGNLAAMVYERLTCGSVFDFLDYMQPDPIFLESRFRRGTPIINSGILLQVSIVSSWFALVCWIAISYYNAISIFKSTKQLLCFKT